jgi:hypothetical protein
VVDCGELDGGFLSAKKSHFFEIYFFDFPFWEFGLRSPRIFDECQGDLSLVEKGCCAAVE